MGWPIDGGDFEELTFEYNPEELGIDTKNAAKIQEIRRLRPLVPNQPWGIFFVKFEPKRLPVVGTAPHSQPSGAQEARLRQQRPSGPAWAKDDLLFVSNYGVGDERPDQLRPFFERPRPPTTCRPLKVLGWDSRDTALHLDTVATELTEHLAWPKNDGDANAWREQWRAAFTLRHREVITTSSELSVRLAELARTIRDRITTASPSRPNAAS